MKPEFIEYLFKKNKGCQSCPSQIEIEDFMGGLLQLLFPAFDKREFSSLADLESFQVGLRTNMSKVLTTGALSEKRAEEVSRKFFYLLPELYKEISKDVDAMYDGDPAARSRTEIIRTYPGFYAIASYRIAHQLKDLGVELIPRIITERAHSKTGIDIHPGAQIGSHFCIDHGTGVVIGETTIIGNHVKIYQGVTLGGLSVDKADAKKKRHPTIEDHVVVYAGATILGGNTIIGENSIIGGNVWLTRSVPPNTKVYYRAALTDKEGETDIIEFK